MRVEVTAVHPEDGFSTGIILDEDLEPTPVEGLHADLKEGSYGRTPMLTNEWYYGLLKVDGCKEYCFFLAFKFKEVPSEQS